MNSTRNSFESMESSRSDSTEASQNPSFHDAAEWIASTTAGYELLQFLDDLITRDDEGETSSSQVTPTPAPKRSELLLSSIKKRLGSLRKPVLPLFSPQAPQGNNASIGVSFRGSITRIVIVILLLSSWIGVNTKSYLDSCPRLDIVRKTAVALWTIGFVWVLYELLRYRRRMSVSNLITTIAAIVTWGGFLGSSIGAADSQCNADTMWNTAEKKFAGNTTQSG